MKTMTCKQLGGACDKKFHANTFDEMAGLSKKHGIWRYFNDLTIIRDEMHGQALATLKSRLCGSCPAVVALAIACHLASAFVLFRVVARG